MAYNCTPPSPNGGPTEIRLNIATFVNGQTTTNTGGSEASFPATGQRWPQ